MSEQTRDNLISPQAADKLIRAHDGDVALLYLFRALTGSEDRESAAKALCRTMREIETAEEKLCRMGLGSFCAAPVSPAPVNDAGDEPLPEYKAEDIVRRCREDAAFTAILEEARKVMGRSLSSVDMKTLFAIYDYIGLPVDVMMLMINYCGRVYEERYHGQRRPTARAIQKEADKWARQEIITMEQAEAFMRRQDERRSMLTLLKETLGIKGRELSPTERDYLNSWLNMGFDEKCIAIAYDRTVTNTGSLKWSYMNKILQSWQEKGLKTEKDILEKDGRRNPRQNAKTVSGPKAIDLAELDRLIDKI